MFALICSSNFPYSGPLQAAYQYFYVKIKECRLSFFFIFFLILFPFQFIFHSSIFRTLGLRLEVIGHTVTSVISDGMVTALIIGLEKRE